MPYWLVAVCSRHLEMPKALATPVPAHFQPLESVDEEDEGRPTLEFAPGSFSEFGPVAHFLDTGKNGNPRIKAICTLWMT